MRLPRNPKSILSWVAGALVAAASASGCSVFHTRPVQPMSDTAAALRAAREVQADVLAPELYRQANESFFKARRHYKFKNFQQAEEYAVQSRLLAERAEFEAIRSGANRSDSGGADPYAELPGGPSADPEPVPPSEPYPYPTPEPVPASSFDEPAPSPSGGPSPVPDTAP